LASSVVVEDWSVVGIEIGDETEAVKRPVEWRSDTPGPTG
jgi:hypothetical protein